MTQLQAKAHGLDIGAAFEQVAQHVGPQTIRALNQFTRFLQRLPDADFTQHLQQSAFRRGNQGPTFLVERKDLEQCVRPLLEEPLAVVFSWKALSEPIREPARFPAIKMKNRPWGNVVADAVPV